MQKKKVGTSDVQISEMILGCWVMGGAQWGGADDNESIRAIHAARDAGMTTLDTAEGYNNGYSETIVGRAIQDHPHDYVISTKVGAKHLRRDVLKETCESSLRRLGRDYLDIYFVHWPSNAFGGELVPFDETMIAMEDLKKEGKIRAIGLSNFGLEDFEEAKKYARVDVYQPPFNMLWRKIEEEMLPYCVKNDISVMAYSPIAQGLLTGKFTMETKFAEGDARSETPLFLPENRVRALELVEKMRPLTEKYGQTLAQIAIRWVMQFPGITAPIVGGRTAEQVCENVGATGWEMEAQDFDLINEWSREFWSNTPKYRHFFNTEIV